MGSMEAGGAGSRLEQRAGADNAAAAAAAEMPAQTSCWACRTLVHVPVVDGQLAPEFKVATCPAFRLPQKRSLPPSPAPAPIILRISRYQLARCPKRPCIPLEPSNSLSTAWQRMNQASKKYGTAVGRSGGAQMGAQMAR